MRENRPIDFIRLWASGYNKFLLDAFKKIAGYYGLSQHLEYKPSENMSYQDLLWRLADHYKLKPIALEKRYDRLKVKAAIIARDKKTNKPVLFLPRYDENYVAIYDDDNGQGIIKIKNLSYDFDNIVQFFPINNERYVLKNINSLIAKILPSFRVMVFTVVIGFLVASVFWLSTLVLEQNLTHPWPLLVTQIFLGVIAVCLMYHINAISWEKYGTTVIAFLNNFLSNLSQIKKIDTYFMDYVHAEWSIKRNFTAYKTSLALVVLLLSIGTSFLLDLFAFAVSMIIIVITLLWLSCFFAKKFLATKRQYIYDDLMISQSLSSLRESLFLGQGLHALSPSIARLNHHYKKFSRTSFKIFLSERYQEFLYLLLPLLMTAIFALGLDLHQELSLWQSAYAVIFSLSIGVAMAYLAINIFRNVVDGNRKNREENSASHDRHIVLAHVSGNLEIAALSFSYHSTGQVIFKGLSLLIKAHKVHLLTGPAGIGKTTLLKIMMGFLRPDNGQIIYDGHDLRSLDKTSLRKNFGVVFANAHLFCGTIYENILCSRTISENAVRKLLLSHEIFDHILDLPMGLSTYIIDNGSNIAHFEKCVIVLARALVHEPKFIFIDDILNSLSADNQKIIINYLIELNVTCVITSSRPLHFDLSNTIEIIHL